MPETISVSLDVRLGSGASWGVTRQIDVAAIDVVDVKIEGSASDREIPIQPGGDVRFMMVMADPPATSVTYKTSSSGSKAYALDQPHLLIGEGAVGMLEGSAAPTSMFFDNGGTAEVRVTVLVGRNLPP